MTTFGTLLYVHQPRPPYERIAGPIYPSSFTHQTGLSVQSNAHMVLSAADVREEWLRPGMCWFADQRAIGEEPWAGFVADEPLPFRATNISIPLIGPKEGLLSVEVAVRLPMPVTRGFAIKRVIEIAQELDIGLFPGIIEEEGASVLLDVRGETASQFIDTIKQASTMDWRERCVPEGNGLVFYIDFGALRRPTNIVLEAPDLADGVNEFTRHPFVASMTVLGEAVGFAARAARSTGVNRSGAAPNSAMTPLDVGSAQLINSRDIGPAAARHRIEISERFGGEDLSTYIFERHLELLRGVDQVTLTLDGTRANVQRVRLGDVVNLLVPNWAFSLNVSAKLHVREIKPDAAAGKREMFADVLAATTPSLT